MRISDWSSDVCSSDLLQLLEIGFGDTARVARMPVIFFVLGLIAGHDNFGRIDNDDIVACVNVGRAFWLVLAAQTACDFAGHTTEDFALGEIGGSEWRERWVQYVWI